VWIGILGISRGDLAWFIRESPGILLLASYFIGGAVFALRRRWRQPGMCRLLAATLLLQLAFLVPAKMTCRALFHLKYFVSIHEFHLNI
jgi:heme/copper-type cytochrome/quinol oxidase subunit 3